MELIDLSLKNLQLVEQKHLTDIAELQLQITRMAFLPHNMLPVSVTREGSRWACTYACHPDPLQCVVAYGESPAQACTNFDFLWDGKAEFLIDQEEEPEEF